MPVHHRAAAQLFGPNKMPRRQLHGLLLFDAAERHVLETFQPFDLSLVLADLSSDGTC
jgi:hypothetical protein